MSITPKKSAIEAETKDQVKLRCSDCMHYKGTAHPIYGERCADRGVSRSALAPTCFTPNVAVFRRHSTDTLRVLATLVSQFNAQECRVLIGTLNKASRLEKYGFTYMEQVYFQVGESYLGNFYRGHVLAPGINETLLIIGAKQVDARAPTLAHLPADSVISAKKFKKLRSRLISQGRINDPQARRKRLPIMTHVDYEPPTIDAAQDVLGELNKVPTRRSNLKVVKGGDVKLVLRRKSAPSSLGEV